MTCSRTRARLAATTIATLAALIGVAAALAAPATPIIASLTNLTVAAPASVSGRLAASVDYQTPGRSDTPGRAAPLGYELIGWVYPHGRCPTASRHGNLPFNLHSGYPLIEQGHQEGVTHSAGQSGHARLVGKPTPFFDGWHGGRYDVCVYLLAETRAGTVVAMTRRAVTLAPAAKH
jgi:hypothetical protein